MVRLQKALLSRDARQQAGLAGEFELTRPAVDLAPIGKAEMAARAIDLALDARAPRLDLRPRLCIGKFS